MGLFKRCSNIGGAAHYINSILLKYDNCRPIGNSIIDKSIQPGSVVHGEDAQQNSVGRVQPALRILGMLNDHRDTVVVAKFATLRGR